MANLELFFLDRWIRTMIDDVWSLGGSANSRESYALKMRHDGHRTRVLA